MSELDKKQFDLVLQCVEPLKLGFNQRGVSGNVCSWLFRDFLRRQFKKDFPHVHFDDGIVFLGNEKEWQESSKSEKWTKQAAEKLSPQCDIIVYQDKRLKKMYEYVLVPKKKVFLIIEIKKWINLSDLTKNIGTQIDKREKIGKPVFLVGLRTGDDVEKLRKNSPCENIYVFAKKSTGMRYPDKKDFEKVNIHGQLERLMTDMKACLNG